MAASNSGFLLLGYIVEEVSGVPYGTFIHDNLLKPIGMNDTATDTIAAIVPHRAHGFRSQIMTMPDEKLTVVMLVNADVPGDVRERIFDAAVALGQGKK